MANSPAAWKAMLMNAADESILESPPGAMSPAHVQAFSAFDDETAATFSPASAFIPQTSSVNIGNAKSALTSASSGDEEDFLPASLNPSTVFALAPRAATFSNAPSSQSFAPASPVEFVNPHSAAGAHLIRTASPAHPMTFTTIPAGHTIIPLEAVGNLARTPSSFVISPSPISTSAMNAAPTFMVVPSSGPAVHYKSSNSPANSFITSSDVSCPGGFLCSPQPAAHISLRDVAAANLMDAQSPSFIAWNASPATSPVSSHEVGAKLIPVSAPAAAIFAPVSADQTPATSPLVSLLVKSLA